MVKRNCVAPPVNPQPPTTSLVQDSPTHCRERGKHERVTECKQLYWCENAKSYWRVKRSEDILTLKCQAVTSGKPCAYTERAYLWSYGTERDKGFLYARTVWILRISNLLCRLCLIYLQKSVEQAGVC